MDAILPSYPINELPSRFIGYPEGVKIFVSPHSFGSALNIELVGQNNYNSMSETLQGVKVEGMPKNLLTVPDILFLGIYRNLVSSKHDKIDLRSFCPKCLHENHHIKTLKSIKFKEIEGFNKDVYPLKVTFSDYEIWFEFLSYKDFEFCMRKYKGARLAQLALQVTKYQNKSTGEITEKPEYNLNSTKESSFIKIKEYVDDLRKILFNFVDEDKDVLDEVINILEDYGIKPIEVECQDELCKHTYSISLEEDNILVKPFRESEESIRNRIKLCKDDIDQSDRIEKDEPKRSGTSHRTSDNSKEQLAELEPNEKDQITYFNN